MSCNYSASIPSSPGIIFILDEPPTPYNPSPGDSVDFQLICEENKVLVAGNSLISSFGTTYSVIDRGNLIRSNAWIKTPIVSNGQVTMIPSVMAAENVIGDSIISSQSGVIIVTIFELGQNLFFSDVISHLRGRVISGYPDAPIISQVYEMSNNRSLTIPDVPENASYAVFLPTTDFNLTDEELRRGTVDITFEFDHDVKDIKQIKVWLQTPSNSILLDRMKIIDYPGGQTEPHILDQPFKYSSVLNVPIHCISKKENQFFVEIEYKNEEILGLVNFYRTMREKERYIIPFQAHFDNRNPYLNIADHSFFNGPGASSNIHFEKEYVEIGQQFLPVEDLRTGISQGSNNLIYFISNFDALTRIFCIPDDDIKTNISNGANSNIYFMYEFVDQTIENIGG